MNTQSVEFPPPQVTILLCAINWESVLKYIVELVQCAYKIEQVFWMCMNLNYIYKKKKKQTNRLELEKVQAV